jgi:hypothetical protein
MIQREQPSRQRAEIETRPIGRNRQPNPTQGTSESLIPNVEVIVGDVPRRSGGMLGARKLSVAGLVVLI